MQSVFSNGDDRASVAMTTNSALRRSGQQQRPEQSILESDDYDDFVNDDDDSLLDVLKQPAPAPYHGRHSSEASEVSSLSSMYTTPNAPSIARNGAAAARASSGKGRGTSGNSSRSSQEALNEMKRKVERQTRQNRILLCASVAVAMLAVGVGVGVAVVLVRGGNAESGTAGPRTTFPPTDPPGVATPQPTSAPSVRTSDGPSILSREELEGAVRAKSPTAAFDVFSSASKQAMDWLVGDDSNDYSQSLLEERNTDKLLQRYALAALYYSIAGSDSQETAESRTIIDETWLSSTDECTGWTGITCNAEGRVTEVNLAASVQATESNVGPSDSLQLSVDFFLLLAETLQIFNLSQNQLSQSTVPTEVGTLRQLTALSLGENQFVGTIPTQLSDLTMLGHLVLGSNLLDGAVPSLTDLAQLSYLDLRANENLGGDLFLEGMDSLLTLLVDSTNITSDIPVELCSTLEQATVECSSVICSCCADVNGNDCNLLSSSPSVAPSIDGSEAPSMLPSFNGSEAPSRYPSMSPSTSEPTVTPTANALTREDVVDAILAQSPTSNLVNSNSAAKQALDWLVLQDSYSADLLEGGATNLNKILQRFALATLYESTDGENWSSSRNWMSTRDVCRGWYGIECEEQEVANISLPNIDLKGPLPKEMFIFLKDSLVHVSMNENQVTGSIPTEVGLARRLEVFTILENELTGKIPTEIGNMESLVFLNLGRNNLDGSIPRTIGDLSKLTHFGVLENELTGKIPKEIAKVVTLTQITATMNELTGPIPPIPQLTALTMLNLAGNVGMSGSLPDDFGTLQLKAIYLQKTGLSGIMPISLCDTLERAWIECDNIRCSCCQAKDDVSCPSVPTASPAPTPSTPAPTTPLPSAAPTIAPTSLPTASPTQANIRSFVLHASPTSTVDDASSPAGRALDWMLSDPHSLAIVSPTTQSSTVLVGAAAVVQRFAIATLYYALDGEGWTGGENEGWLATTTTNGSLEDGSECFWDQDHLRCNSDGEINWIKLFGINGMSGSVPMELGLLSDSLTSLNLARNRNGIYGAIPAQLGALTRLTDLSLDRNDLTGRLPKSLNDLVNMEKLQIHENSFIGELLSNVGDWDELQHFSANKNFFTGTIPFGISGLSKLTLLALQENRLEGPIPDDFEELENIQYLSLYDNADLNGTIAPSLCASLLTAEIDCGNIECECCTANDDDDECP